jgi:hypothetical protein
MRSSNVFGDLLPQSLHLVCSRLLATIKNICSKGFTQAFLACRACASVVLATPASSSASRVAASSATASSSSSTHNGGVLPIPIGLLVLPMTFCRSPTNVFVPTSQSNKQTRLLLLVHRSLRRLLFNKVENPLIPASSRMIVATEQSLLHAVFC